MVFQDQLRKDIEIFFDDFCVYGKEEDHPQALARCFIQCSKFGISLNAAKCQFVVPYGKNLGHIVSADGIGVDPDKITLIENFPRPQTVRGVRSFYGLANYYRRAIASFAEIASLLFKLLKKLDTSTSPIWNKACETAFLTLKKKLVSAPVLVPPNWAEPFHVYVDASLIALGCVLSQGILITQYILQVGN